MADTAQILAEATAQAREQLVGLRRDLVGIVEAGEGGADDEHDPEGTTAFERAQLQATIDATEKTLLELEAAAERLAAGRYGICEECGQPIATERLRARPVARTCIGCARRA